MTSSAQNNEGGSNRVRPENPSPQQHHQEIDPTTQQLIEPEDALPEVTLEQLPEPLRQAVANAGWKWGSWE